MRNGSLWTGWDPAFTGTSNTETSFTLGPIDITWEIWSQWVLNHTLTSKAACGIQTHIFHYNQSVLKQMEDTCLKTPSVVWKPSYCARCTAFSIKIASSFCFGKSNGIVWKDPHWGLDLSSFSKIRRNMAGALCLLLNPPQFKAI